MSLYISILLIEGFHFHRGLHAVSVVVWCLRQAWHYHNARAPRTVE